MLYSDVFFRHGRRWGEDLLLVVQYFSSITVPGTGSGLEKHCHVFRYVTYALLWLLVKEACTISRGRTVN